MVYFLKSLKQSAKYLETTVMDMQEGMELLNLNIKPFHGDFQTSESVLCAFLHFCSIKVLVGK